MRRMQANSSAMLTPAPAVSAIGRLLNLLVRLVLGSWWVLSCHWMMLEVVGWEDDSRPGKGGTPQAASGEATSANGGLGAFEFLGLTA